MERSRILVIIVTYNAMAWVDRCMGCLLNTTIPCDVLVVDNGSTDGTQNYIKEHYPNYLFKQCEKNLGFGRANNIGLQKVLDEGYEFAYLLNQDAWVMPDTFEKLMEISNNNPEYGILSPIQIKADMCHMDDYFAKNVIGSNQQSNPLLVDDLFFGRRGTVYDVTSVMAAHWLLTRDCLLKVGGFSPSFPHYGEDDNYIQRSLFKNKKVGIIPSLRVVHDRGNRKEDNKRKIYMGYIRSLIALSSPDKSVLQGVLYMITISVGLSLTFKSAKPIHNIFKVLFRIHEIRKNRRVSMNNDCAFLRKKNITSVS